jgi:hypothetical protein
MRRSYQLLSILLLSSTLGAWGKQQPPVQPEMKNAPDSPFNANQGWFVEESLLIWHPFEDGLDFGAKYKTEGAASSKMSVEIPDFEWGTGARLTVGRYLPNHQLWDVNLAATYFYAEAKKTSRANPGDGQFIVSAFEATTLGAEITKATARWQINYYTWDLDVARSYLMTPKIVVHPHLGLRAALIYLDFDNRNTNIDVHLGFPVNTKTRFDTTNSMWGIGPRLGTDFSFDFAGDWSFLGNFAASLLYTNFSLNESFDGVVLPNQAIIKTERTYNFLTTNLETALGLGWERWVRKETVRVAASFLFEASEWFNMNRLFHLGIFIDELPTPVYNRGDLGLIGFSVNLHVDF